MTSQPGDLQSPNLDAATGDPRLGVHVLTEFFYCPRAGVVAFESQPDDCGEDERPGRLDYLPRYDLQNIEAALASVLRRLALLGVLLLFVAVITTILMTVWGSGIFWAGGMFFVLLLIPTGLVTADVIRLTARRTAALSAVGREPLLGTRDEPEPIDWWQLRNAGFTAKRYEDPLHDEHWKLAGRPYLVLCRGDVRIPVFRQHRPQEKVYRQHFARIAAYCHLIERCTGFKSPYGVILFAKTYKGVALRNSPAARKAFHDGLKAARRIARESRVGSEPPPPDAHICLQCPIGKPVVYRAGVTESVSTGGVLPVRGAIGPDKKLYHSRCGDRFRWLPPHERVQELPLWSVDN
jgi:hypothetical protein